MGGRLKDPGLASLLRELAYHNPGLCIITTRLSVEDLAEFSSDVHDPEDAATVLSHDLNLLSPEAGVQPPGTFGGSGSSRRTRSGSPRISRERPGPHPLGSLLGQGYGGDIRCCHEIEILRETKYRRPRPAGDGRLCRVVCRTAGIKYFAPPGHFDCPAPPGAIDALKAQPPIPGPLFGVTGAFIPGLARGPGQSPGRPATGPVGPGSAGYPGLPPPYPGIFWRALKEENSEAWREAHSRLYEYYKTQAPEFPDTLEAMLPLNAAVAHGCQAARHQEAMDKVYRAAHLRRGERMF